MTKVRPQKPRKEWRILGKTSRTDDQERPWVQGVPQNRSRIAPDPVFINFGYQNYTLHKKKYFQYFQDIRRFQETCSKNNPRQHNTTPGAARPPPPARRPYFQDTRQSEKPDFQYFQDTRQSEKPDFQYFQDMRKYKKIKFPNISRRAIINSNPCSI